MTQLNGTESALLLTQLALRELNNLETFPLQVQLAQMRLGKVVEVLRGVVDMSEYERKVLGPPREPKR